MGRIEASQKSENSKLPPARKTVLLLEVGQQRISVALRFIEVLADGSVLRLFQQSSHSMTINIETVRMIRPVDATSLK